jgi:hypothetical protein
MDVARFRVEIAPAVLDELRQRIARTRWPDAVDGADWAYGANLTYLRELAGYWRDHFDWSAQEVLLNGFDHFHTQIGGRRIHFIHFIHFIHARATGATGAPAARPALLPLARCRSSSRTAGQERSSNCSN